MTGSRQPDRSDLPGDSAVTPTPTDERPERWPARLIPIERCAANPRNPRDGTGDLSDLESLGERQLQSCLAVTSEAYLKLWPEDAEAIGARAEVVVIAGNRRLRAARRYGRADLIVVVDDSLAVSRAKVMRAALDENTMRRDLDPIEEAKAVVAVVAQYDTAKDAGDAEGWSGTWMTQRKQLLNLQAEVQELVRARARDPHAYGIPIRDARRLGAIKGVARLSAAEQIALWMQMRLHDRARKVSDSAARRKAKDTSATSASTEFSAENREAAVAAGSERRPPGPATAASATDADGRSAAKPGRLAGVPATSPRRRDAAEGEKQSTRDRPDPVVTDPTAAAIQVPASRSGHRPALHGDPPPRHDVVPAHEAGVGTVDWSSPKSIAEQIIAHLTPAEIVDVGGFLLEYVDSLPHSAR
ncbi:ParB/RepB/Spo0J family partition protein [Streptacidiphilus sp. MAP12-16]|uniref:ParB/RepB/Spo0J family partition protein n=1 Tax=Streptacidiphilus sp. MAP12-16 TaxID=3156300 RepID=UPI0035158559